MGTDLTNAAGVRQDFQLSCVAPELSLQLSRVVAKAATVRINCAVLRMVPVDLFAWYRAFASERDAVEWMWRQSLNVDSLMIGAKLLMRSPGESFIPYVYFDGQDPHLDAIRAVREFESIVLPAWRREIEAMGTGRASPDLSKWSHYIQSGDLEICVARFDNREWNSYWTGDLQIEAKVARQYFGKPDSPWLALNQEASKKLPFLLAQAESGHFLDVEAPEVQFTNYIIRSSCLALLSC